MPTQELGLPAYRKFDIEAWMPGRGKYGEVREGKEPLGGGQITKLPFYFLITPPFYLFLDFQRLQLHRLPKPAAQHHVQ